MGNLININSKLEVLMLLFQGHNGLCKKEAGWRDALPENVRNVFVAILW